MKRFVPFLVVLFPLLFLTVGQTFGPKVIKPRIPVWSPPAPPHLYYWWHASDLTNSTSLMWTDRIAGSVFSSVGGTFSIAGTGDTNRYVVFDGSTTVLSNQYISVLGGANVSNQLALILQMGDLVNDDPLLVTTNNLSYIGLYVRQNHGYWYDAGWPDSIYPVGGTINDIEYCYGSTYTEIPVYTNGVLSVDYYAYPLVSDGYILGWSPRQPTWFATMNLYDVFIFTNTAVDVVVSNVHWWKTNYYGGP